MQTRLLSVILLLVVLAPAARAQSVRLASIEAVTGDAAFIDESWDHRSIGGGAARVGLTPRLAVGPEVLYLRGPGGAHDVTATAAVTFDLVRPSPARRVVPFIAAGVGLVRQTRLVGGGPGSTRLVPYTSSEGTVSGGVGARIALGRHLFVAPDVRLGWEPETRASIAVGWRP